MAKGEGDRRMLDYGVVTISAFEHTLSADHEMKVFSDSWLRLHRRALKSYPGWADALSVGTRPWEYSICRKAIDDHSKEHTAEMTILDAGSGLTFFPYFIHHQYPMAEIHCIDYDERLMSIFSAVNRISEYHVHYESSDMRNLRYAENSFDIIYCASVLEHTEDYESIIREFKRVLKRSGTLVLTFDICLDGKQPISRDQAIVLLQTIRKHFSPVKNYDQNLNDVTGSNTLTSRYIVEHYPERDPWKPKLPMLRLIARRMLSKSKRYFSDLTVFGMAFKKT